MPTPGSTAGLNGRSGGFSQCYERGSVIITSNLPFDEWTEIFGSERLTGALLDRLTHHVHILEMNGESFRLKQSQKRRNSCPSHLSRCGRNLGNLRHPRIPFQQA